MGLEPKVGSQRVLSIHMALPCHCTYIDTLVLVSCRCSHNQLMVVAIPQKCSFFHPSSHPNIDSCPSFAGNLHLRWALDFGPREHPDVRKVLGSIVLGE